MQPVISEKDYEELGQMLTKGKYYELKFLKTLLQRLRIVKEQDISKKTIRLNSLVVLWHSLLKKFVRFRIVLPEKADLKKRQISVLSPISIALMGHTENDTLTIHAPGVEKQLRIIKVTNS